MYKKLTKKGEEDTEDWRLHHSNSLKFHSTLPYHHDFFHNPSFDKKSIISIRQGSKDVATKSKNQQQKIRFEGVDDLEEYAIKNDGFKNDCLNQNRRNSSHSHYPKSNALVSHKNLNEKMRNTNDMSEINFPNQTLEYFSRFYSKDKINFVKNLNDNYWNYDI